MILIIWGCPKNSGGAVQIFLKTKWYYLEANGLVFMKVGDILVHFVIRLPYFVKVVIRSYACFL